MTVNYSVQKLKAHKTLIIVIIIMITTIMYTLVVIIIIILILVTKIQEMQTQKQVAFLQHFSNC